MGARTLRKWALVHKWTSLICTLFLLLLCITGLPLLFQSELQGWLMPHHYVALSSDIPAANLDHLVNVARRLYPDQVVTAIFADDDEPQTLVWLTPSWPQMRANPGVQHFVRFDSRTGELLERSPTAAQQRPAFLIVLLNLHITLFAGLAGQLFLAMMGALFAAALVSGVALYGPFARKQAFGTLRAGRRLRWLDLHNVLGIVLLAWTFVVGTTGIMNELSAPLFTVWQRTEVQGILRQVRNLPPLDQNKLASVQAAVSIARTHLPGMVMTSVAFPGAPTGSPAHYLVWMHGSSPLTSRLFNPVLINARSGAFVAVVKMPWYLRTLEISRPLHFGDYGGLPLKVIWALLDIATILVLGSGLYLWFARRKTSVEKRTDELEQVEAEPGLDSIRSAAE